MIFWLLLMVLPVGSEGPDVVGQWNLVDVQWLDPDRLEPPREIKLSLLGDGTARLETAVVSRSYRMTTDGCKVNETRRDPLSLEGRYRVEGQKLVFDWPGREGAEKFLSVYFPDARGWPVQVNSELKVSLPQVTLVFERVWP